MTNAISKNVAFHAFSHIDGYIHCGRETVLGNFLRINKESDRSALIVATSLEAIQEERYFQHIIRFAFLHTVFARALVRLNHLSCGLCLIRYLRLTH